MIYDRAMKWTCLPCHIFLANILAIHNRKGCTYTDDSLPGEDTQTSTLLWCVIRSLHTVATVCPQVFYAASGKSQSYNLQMRSPYFFH